MFRDKHDWRRNLTAVWIGQFFSVVGFSCVIPFFPLYVQELGVTDPRQVEIWAGLLGSAAGVAMALASPFWGSLADRHGRKPMLLRAAFGGSILLGAMSLVRNVYELLFLRFAQGTVTGVISAANTLIASFTPRERIGFALGSLQMAVFVGNSIGPLIGGLIADALGFRYAFVLTAIMLALGGLVVLIFVHERFQPLAKAERPGLSQGLRQVIHRPTLLMFAATTMVIQGSQAMVFPVFPLFVQRVVDSPEGGVAALVGLIFSVAGIVSAVSALLIGRLSDTLGHRRTLAICAIGAGLSHFPQAFSTDAGQILFWRAVLGLFVGGMLPSVTALLSLHTPREIQGAAFGINATASSVGHAVGPLTGALVATALGIPAVLITAGMLLLTIGLAAAGVGSRPQPPASSPSLGIDSGEPVSQ